jgi:hypothetical protein
MTPNHKWLQHGRISNLVEIIWLILSEHTSPNFSVFHKIKFGQNHYIDIPQIIFRLKELIEVKSLILYKRNCTLNIEISNHITSCI